MQEISEKLSSMTHPSELCSICMAPWHPAASAAAAAAAIFKTSCFHFFHQPCIAAFVHHTLQPPVMVH